MCLQSMHSVNVVFCLIQWIICATVGHFPSVQMVSNVHMYAVSISANVSYFPSTKTCDSMHAHSALDLMGHFCPQSRLYPLLNY